MKTLEIDYIQNIYQKSLDMITNGNYFIHREKLNSGKDPLIVKYTPSHGLMHVLDLSPM